MELTTQQQMLVEQRLANNKKSTGVAYLLWFFLGGLGVHRFYLGSTGPGVGILILSIFGWPTAAFVVGLFLLAGMVIWLIVDAFLIPGMIEKSNSAMRAMIMNEVSLTTAKAP